MTSLSGDFQTDLSIDVAMVACSEAIDGLGWRLEDVESDRIVAFSDSNSEHPARIEIGLSEAGKGSEFRIIGSDSEQDPLEEDELISVLDRARDAINGAMEAAERPRRTDELEQSAKPAETARQYTPAEDERGDQGSGSGTAAGWYPDVHDDSRERYWDGDKWTDQFRPLGGGAEPKPPKPSRSGRKQAGVKRQEGDGAATAIPAKFRSLQLIASIYGVLGWLVAVLGPIAVIAAAASANGSDAAVTLIGGLLGVAFYALLLFGLAAAIRLALAIEENTRNTVEMLKARNDRA